MRKIKYIYFGEPTGYGIAAQTLMASLKEEGVKVVSVSILPGEVWNGGVKKEGDTEGHNFDAVIVHAVPEYYPFWLEVEKKRNPKAPVWGYTAWETSRIPVHWLPLLNEMDGLFVPSNWNREVFRNCGITTRIEVLPHISQFHGHVDKAERLQLPCSVRNDFLFYSVGVWSERKNLELLIEAFSSEFSETEKVALILKTGKRDWTKQGRKWYNLFRKRFELSSNTFKKLTRNGRRCRIVHIDEDLSDTEIADLHQSGDCFVSLTRGEGWGMGAYEAAWFAKPVVTTRFGGALDFLPAEHAYLLEYSLVPVSTEFGKGSYTADQQWAEVDLEHARKMLRYVFENREEAMAKGLRLKDYVAGHFNAGVIARKCLNAIYD